MFNMAIGLSLITYWVSFYFSLPGIGLASHGVALAPLVVLVGSFIGWICIFLKIRVADKSHFGKIQARILLVGNVWAVSTIVFHTYNATYYAAFPSAGSGIGEIEEIMNLGFSKKAELLLGGFYPFSKVLVIFGVVAGGRHIYKSDNLLIDTDPQQ